jgi:hypothetical protein
MQYKNKMKISPSFKFNCVKCPPGSEDTLEHTYMNCPRCKKFFEKVENLIKNFVDPCHPSDSKSLSKFAQHAVITKRP